MKRALARMAFLMAVLTVFLGLVVPSMVATEALFPVGRGPDGLYRGGDRLPFGIVVIAACLWIANRLTSFWFWRSGISAERWSLFSTRRS